MKDLIGGLEKTLASYNALKKYYETMTEDYPKLVDRWKTQNAEQTGSELPPKFESIMDVLKIKKMFRLKILS